MPIELLQQQLVGIRREAVRNAAELTPNVTLKADSNTLQAKPSYTTEKIINGSRDNTYDEYQTMQMVEGEITGHVNNRDIGALLFFAFGQVTSTIIAATTAYTHTFTPLNQTTLPTFTAFYRQGDAGMYKARGCVIDELKIEFGESESKFTATIKGLEETEVTNSTERTNILAAISYGAPDPKLLFGNLVFTHAATITALGAIVNNVAGTGTIMNLTPGLSISIKNNVEFDMSSASTANAFIKPLDTYAKAFEGSMEMTGLIRSKIPYDYNLAATVRAFEAMLVNVGAPVVGTSTVRPELRFRFPQAIPKVEIDRPLDDALAYKINLDNPITSVAEGFSMQARVINTIVSY